MNWRRLLPPLLVLPLIAGSCDINKCFPNRDSTPASSSLRASTQESPALFSGAGSLLPMLNAFPTCQTTLVIGTSTVNSEERVDFGAVSNSFAGSFACFTANQPVRINATEGAVEVTVEAAAIALPDPNPLTSVARFAIEGRSSISGGTASAAPSWDVQVGYRFPHTGSPTGTEPIRFGATLINVRDAGGVPPLPVVASVFIDCGVGAPTELPLNGGTVDIPVEAASSCGMGCACTANATLSGGAAATAGEAVQRLTVIAFNTNGLCGSNLTCFEADPSNPFCVDDFGCSDGSVGMPCDHDSQCDEASDVICAASLLCEDGSAGTPCSQAGDCAVGLVCNANVCSAT